MSSQLSHKLDSVLVIIVLIISLCQWSVFALGLDTLGTLDDDTRFAEQRIAHKSMTEQPEKHQNLLSLITMALDQRSNQPQSYLLEDIQTPEEETIPTKRSEDMYDLLKQLLSTTIALQESFSQSESDKEDTSLNLDQSGSSIDLSALKHAQRLQSLKNTANRLKSKQAIRLLAALKNTKESGKSRQTGSSRTYDKDSESSRTSDKDTIVTSKRGRYNNMYGAMPPFNELCRMMGLSRC